MLLSLSITSFAENPGVISSHVEFEVTDAGVSAKAFVRDLNSMYTKNEESGQWNLTEGGTWANLFFAAYDASGKLIDAKVSTGRNDILKTEAVAIPEGGSAKAFVWENGSEKVISNVAVYKASDYDFEDVLDTLEITFGGKSFADFVGTAFNKATTSYGPVTITGEVFPELKATVKDNATLVNAYATSSAYIVEVKSTTSMGADITYSANTHRGSTATTVNRPNYTYSKTYTISYTIGDAAKPTKINPEKEVIFINAGNFSDGIGSTPSGGWGNTNYAMINAASSEITVTDTSVKVDVTIGADIKQNGFSLKVRKRFWNILS